MLRHHSVTPRHPRPRHRWGAAALSGLLLSAWCLSTAQAAPTPRLDFTPQEIAFARAVSRDAGLAAWYGSHALAPVFVGPQAAARRTALIDSIATAPSHGLPVARYGLDRLRQLDAAGDEGEIEIAFAHAFARWTHDVGGGLLDPRKIGLRREVLREPADALLGRFAASPDPAGVLASVPPQDPRYRALQHALAASSNETAASGKKNMSRGARTRALLIALERMRWLNGHDLTQRVVWVNLPEFVARVQEDGHTVFQTKVVIGKADDEFQTPEFSDEMEDVVVNPRWNVPRSITVKEYLPRLQKNPNAASQLDVVDGRGNVIPRSKIDFGRYTAANFPYRMRQKPSDDNALGVVKFIFPNPMNIYLHDTPSKGLFAESRRAFSHGCVRVGRPQELALELLRGEVSDPAATFSRALSSGNETYLALKQRIPVHLVYMTTFADENGTVRSVPDVYGRDGAVWSALQRAMAAPAAPLESASLSE